MKHFHDLLLMNQDNLENKEEEDTSPELKSIYIHYPSKELKETYIQHFQEKKIVQIESFLTPYFAEDLFKTSLLEKKWNLASGFGKMKFEKPLEPKFENANQLQVKNINLHFKEDEFTYIFHRSMNNKIPSRMEFLIRQQLSSPEFLSYINQITNVKVTQLSTLFLSKYKSSHFLGPHSDKGNGKLAFVLNLTKFWKPQHGGILHFLSEDRKDIIDSYVPGFNNLILFEVPEEEERPHFVSHVNPYVKHSRFAITGWFR